MLGASVSYVTAVVAILNYPTLRDRRRFEELVQRYAGFTPEPVAPSGPNFTGLEVYHLGLDFAAPELIEALTIGPWPRGSTLRIEPEDGDVTEVRWLRRSATDTLSSVAVVVEQN